jgi:ABC transporter substrate binding protein
MSARINALAHLTGARAVICASNGVGAAAAIRLCSITMLRIWWRSVPTCSMPKPPRRLQLCGGLRARSQNVTDPVGQGFVDSLARPGGYVTGFTDFDPLTAGKWLEMLTQTKPAVLHAAVLYNPATAPFAGLMPRAVQEAAQSFAVTARAAACRDKADMEAMMTGLAREEGCGLLV